MELRWIERRLELPTSASPIEKVLQYRTRLKDDQGYYWTGWQDVPTVTAPEGE